MKREIKIIWWGIGVITRSWFRGKAYKKIDNLRRVLVIQMAKLVDMVCITPMFCAIKKNYLECWVAVLGNGINKEVLAGNKDVDEYITTDKNFRREVKQIKEGRFEAVFLTSPNLFYLIVVYIAGVPLVVASWVRGGFSLFITRSYRFMGQYAPCEYLRLLEAVREKAERSLEEVKKFTWATRARKILSFIV